MRIRRPQESTQLASVTVVIPCYNYGKYLPQVVQSVLSQERVDANIIIVDDASTDGSLAVANSLAAADPRTTVVAHVRNFWLEQLAGWLQAPSRNPFWPWRQVA